MSYAAPFCLRTSAQPTQPILDTHPVTANHPVTHTTEGREESLRQTKLVFRCKTLLWRVRRKFWVLETMEYILHTLASWKSPTATIWTTGPAVELSASRTYRDIRVRTGTLANAKEVHIELAYLRQI